MTLYDHRAFQEYRAKVAELSELRAAIGATISQVAPAEAQRALSELTLRTKEIENLRSSLGRDGVFLATYGVEVLNDHTVSFVLPRGHSQFEILQAAQELINERDNRALIQPHVFHQLRMVPELRVAAASSELFCIDGHVEGGDAKNRAGQERVVAEKGMTLPAPADLIVAFALYWVATGQPLFGWFRDQTGAATNFSYEVRAKFKSLQFRLIGLGVYGMDDDDDSSEMAVAGRVSNARRS